MPAVLREENCAAWLTGSPKQFMRALEPYSSDGVEATGNVFRLRTI
jgi:hypothetical protein